MKTLLITNYWYPYNHSGTMRWLQLANAGLEFDVLTQRKPREGFIDETLPMVDRRKITFLSNIPAVLWGFLVILRVIFTRYDTYIFTQPPSTLVFPAYIMQLLRRNVILDSRDHMETWDNPFREYFLPALRPTYLKIKNRVVSMQHFDYSAYVIRSGYLSLTRKFDDWVFDPWSKRRNYRQYIRSAEFGIITDYRNRPICKATGYPYGSSSFCTLRYLGYKNLPEYFHPEVHNCKLNSWEEAVELYKNYISGVNNGNR